MNYFVGVKWVCIIDYKIRRIGKKNGMFLMIVVIACEWFPI